MPTSLHLDFFSAGRRKIPGGIYCISSPESKYYRPKQGYPRAFKVGSSVSLGDRINSYLLSFPWSHPAGLEIECSILMHANTKGQKLMIQRAERYIHSQLHKIYQEKSHYPGYANGQRLNADRIEWYEDVPLRVIQNVFKRAVESFSGVYVEGNRNYAQAWSDYETRKPLRLRLVSDYL